ncbi:hypothetical protein C8Q79DRAFT_1004985 [Trametes meyenii]|nr:hypothetical protein C8Q79DRAFT_1004985 [Trametes meyenii]
MVAQTSAPGAAFVSLTSDSAIQFILADIPFFAVGILAFGVLTFFFLMKRVDKWVFCLHLSVLIAFLAALFDLSQILIRGRVAVDLGIDNAGVSGLITAREVFYSFANGLRFLFYWGFVATIPLGETIPEGTMMHSGSWRRWGIIGLILKWSTLLLVILITVFQLIYRDVKAFEKIGAVYEAESTLEIIVSAVFILKLLLNTWARFPTGSTSPSKGKMLVQYAPMIVALLFSLWIAVGNVILFEFTETVLGRFLRAIEWYILMVYMLTVSFHHLRHLSFFPIYRPATKGPSRAGTFERNSMVKVDEKAASPPLVPQPVRLDLMQVLEQQFRQQEMPPTMTRDSSRAATIANASQHQSMAARLSTWLGVARPLPRPPQPNLQPWDIDAERGPSPLPQMTAVQQWRDSTPRGSSPPLPPPPPIIDEDEQRGVSPIQDFVVQDFAPRTEAVEHDVTSPAPSDTTDYPIAPGIGVVEPEEDEETTPVAQRNWEEIEFSNAVRYSGMREQLVANALSQPYFAPQDSTLLQPSPSRPTSVDDASYLGSPYPMSPIDSAAVTPVPRSRPLPPMPGPRVDSVLLSPASPLPPDSARSSNMSILRRRQTELDESIAALRLFSPTKPAFDPSTLSVPPSAFYAQYAQSSTDPEGRLSTIRSVDSPELPAPSPDLTLATPHADRLPQSSSHSEFSFSNFPHVPPLNRGSMDSGVIPQMGIAVEEPSEAGDGASRAGTPTSRLAPPQMSAALGSRFSDSSSMAGEGRIRKVSDSLGTQYEITSFIGNLSIPGHKDSTISTSSAGLSDDGPVDVGMARKTDLSAAQYVRPTIVVPPTQNETSPENPTAPVQPSPIVSPLRTASDGRRALPPVPQSAVASQPQQPEPVQPAQLTQPGAPAPRFRRAVGLPPHPRLSVVNTIPREETSKMSPGGTTT